jgi:hypothetical protein
MYEIRISQQVIYCGIDSSLSFKIDSRLVAVSKRIFFI